RCVRGRSGSSTYSNERVTVRGWRRRTPRWSRSTPRPDEPPRCPRASRCCAVRRRNWLVLLAAMLLARSVSRAQLPPTAAEITVSARLLAVGDGRAIDTALVDSVVRSSASWLRVRAVRSIGQVKGLVRAPRVRSLIADPDTAVAATAAFTAGLLRDDD